MKSSPSEKLMIGSILLVQYLVQLFPGFLTYYYYFYEHEPFFRDVLYVIFFSFNGYLIPSSNCLYRDFVCGIFREDFLPEAFFLVATFAKIYFYYGFQTHNVFQIRWPQMLI